MPHSNPDEVIQAGKMTPGPDEAYVPNLFSDCHDCQALR